MVRRPGPPPPEDGDASQSSKPKAALAIPEHVYDAILERTILCAALADAKTRDALTRSIAPDEFLVSEHSPLWRGLRAMTDRQLAPDPLSLRRFVAEEGEVADAYIAGLEAEAEVPPNLAHLVETLRWDATRARTIRGAVPELIRELRDPKAKPETVAIAARAVLRAVERGGGGGGVRRGEELARSYRAEIRTRVAQGNFWSLGMGAAMDARLTEGAMPKRTCVVAGLSGSGKSTWVANMAVRLARQDRRVLLGCWEMDPDSYLDLMVASVTRIELKRVVNGSLTPEEVGRIEKAIDWLTSRIRFMPNPFYRSERQQKGGGRKTNDRNLDLLEGHIAESGCDVGVWDLWERLLVDISYDGVTSALFAQQNMHERYNIWGVIVSQLRGKDVERRADKRPTRDGIKGTGAYVEVADLILGIHREAQFKRVPDDSIEAICLKQRKGEPNWAVAHDWSGAQALVSGDGREVAFDPGLEASAEFGDAVVGDMKQIRTGGRNRKPTRRDG